MGDAAAVKRFYADVTREEADGLWSIRLDGRPVRTPAREVLAVPGAALAQAIVAEWMAQGEAIAPATMPMTGFANASIDRVLPDVAGFAAGIAAYGASDLLCYRASEPADLVAEQAAAWDPLIDWARARYDVAFVITQGVMPVAQPPATLARLAGAVAALDPWLLAGVTTAVSLTGTLIGTLAYLDDATDADRLWDVASLDAVFQARQWGRDAEAEAQSALRQSQYVAATRYCMLVRQS